MKIQNFSHYKFFLLIFILFLTDQVTKYAARSFLEPGQIIVLLPYFLELFYVKNTGISWGIFAGLSTSMRFWVLFLLPLIFVFMILYYVLVSWKKSLVSQKIGFALVLGGAFGNLYDRLFFQFVTDFMHFRFFSLSFFVNNLADDFISIGFFFILWKDIKKILKEFSKLKK